MFAFTEPPPYGLSMLIQFTRWPIMQKVHRHSEDIKKYKYKICTFIL